jgi:hypothetical protein
MRWFFLCTMICAFSAAAETNLVRNPDFEADANGDGCPDEWQAAGDSPSVTQNLSFDIGRDARRCARLSCTRFRAESPASHAMLCQMGVPVQRGRTYRVTVWARGEGIVGDIVSLGLSDTSTWESCGLSGALAPTPEWHEYQFLFRATRDCSTESRFQIWFTSTGTLWVDDVEFVDAGQNPRRPGRIIPSDGRTNLVPNASFESGTVGWGSAERDQVVHWGGRMNRLFGTIDIKEAFHGQCSLRIELTPDTQPLSFFDYFDLHRAPIQAPLAASIGFIEVEPDHPYTLSVYMKAAQADTPARLAIRQFEGRSFEKGVRASERWERYAMTFKPTSRWCYVLAGPDLRKTDQYPEPPPRATVWVDAVQLERAEKSSTFVSRDKVEIGVETDKPGNVFGWDEPLKLLLIAANSTNVEQPAQVVLWLTDFFDAEVWRTELDLMVPACGRIEKELLPQNSDRLRGFLRLHARLHQGDVVSEQTMRLSVIPLHQKPDSRFGVNHAYPWPHLLDLSRRAGLVWVRDWSLKWMDVEPEKGRFTFADADAQINRPLDHGLQMLCMLPFPSSPWSSSAPQEARAGSSYEERRAVVAYAPRDMAEFENYVERTVDHYRGRVTWFQVFNEPLFTSYALPRKEGYGGTTYGEYTKAFARAARRANPECRILAGIGYLQEGQIMQDFTQFFEAGALEVIDAVDIHQYPRIRPPEFIEKLVEGLNSLMEEHGGRKPIWLTEYGYYADDEPSLVPIPHSDFDQPLPSERVQAEYAVRWATILFANGVEKIFYHAGTCAGINDDSLEGVFYEYGGEPHRIYAAQAVMARVFSPSCRFVKRLRLDTSVKGYLFEDKDKLAAVVWAVSGARPKVVRLQSDQLQLLDIMGRSVPAREFVPTGTPVYIVSERMSVPAFEAALQ